MKKRLISMALAASMAFSLLPTPVLAAGGGTALTAGQSLATQADAVTIINNEADLRNAVKASGTYKLAKDITLSQWQVLVLPVGVTVELDLAGHTLKAGYACSTMVATITVRGNLTLTSSEPGGTLDADQKTRGVVVNSGTNASAPAVFTLGDGVTIKNGTISNNDNDRGGGVCVTYGNFLMKDGARITNCESQRGGAVYVDENSIFTMESGTIDSCEANQIGGGNGGAVYVNTNGTFIMENGTIENCTTNGEGGAIYNSGKITPNGGTVHGTVYNSEGEIQEPAGTTATEFKDDVCNEGSIAGGTFAGTVTNENNGKITGGDFTDSVTNKGTIEDGTFTGTVTNENEGKVTGGDFTKAKFTNNGGTVSENDKITKYELILKDAAAKAGGTAVNSGDKLMAGTEVTLTAGAALEGRGFEKWEVTGESGAVTGTESTDADGSHVYTFTMPTENVTAKAVFEAKSYKITVTGGTADPTTAVAGETITLTAEPGEGQELDYWTVNGTKIDGNTFEMPEEDVTAVATFKAIVTPAPASYTITVTGGTADKQTAAAGETITLTAEPGEGQELDYWTVNGTQIEGNTFEMPEEDVTAVATFKAIVTPDPVPEPAQGGGDDLGGAVVAVAAAGAAVWGGYELATRIILHQFLPEGAAIPTNRGALAQLIWQNAGSPEPEATPAFADMTDDAAKAAQWCVEQGIMEAREDGKFEPDGWIPKFRVIEVWNKAFPQ